MIAHIRTDRGCLETGQNPVYTIGEAADVIFQVDGSAGVTEAHVVNFEFRNGGVVSGTDLGTVPTGAPFDYFSPIGPPTGSGAFLLQATAGQVSDQAQCSFTVACTTACDCASGERCSGGACVMAGNPLYCCTAGPCPAGGACQFPSGDFSMCAVP